MKKFLIWLGILILAVALGVLGYKLPGPLENLSNNYRLGLMVGGIVFLLMDFVWAFLKVRGWRKRREEAGKEEWDEEDYEEGEQSVGWGAMPVLIPQQPVSPTPPAPSAPVLPPQQSPAKEEEGKGNAWGKWLIAGAVVLAIVIGVGLAAITSGSGSQSTIAGRPAATQQFLLPSQRLGATRAAQEAPSTETDPVWKLALVLMVFYGMIAGLVYVGFLLTRVEMTEEADISYTLGPGPVSIAVQIVMALRVDPFQQFTSTVYSFVNSRVTVRPRVTLGSATTGMITKQARSYRWQDYKRIDTWQGRVNNWLELRRAGVRLEDLDPADDPDLYQVALQIEDELVPTERDVSLMVVRINFPQDIVAPVLDAALADEEKEVFLRERRRVREEQLAEERRQRELDIERDPVMQATAVVTLAMQRLGIAPGSSQAQELFLETLRINQAELDRALRAQEIETMLTRARAEDKHAVGYDKIATAVNQLALTLSQFDIDGLERLFHAIPRQGVSEKLSRLLTRGET